VDKYWLFTELVLTDFVAQILDCTFGHGQTVNGFGEILREKGGKLSLG